MNTFDYESEVRRTAVAVPTLAMGALGLTGEAGEVADEIKKILYHNKSPNYSALVLELGDVLWYTTYLAHMLGYTLDDVMRINVDKLRKRYPNGWDK